MTLKKHPRAYIPIQKYEAEIDNSKWQEPFETLNPSLSDTPPAIRPHSLIFLK